MSVEHAESLIKAVGKAREPHHDTLYCTHDVKSLLKDKMSAGLGHSGYIENVQIQGLMVHEIPNPSNARSVAIVCKEGGVFPLTKDYE